MVDRTPAALVIHAMPAHQVHTVLRLAELHGLLPDDEAAAIVLGEAVADSDAPSGIADELSAALIDAAPDVAFTIYEDPTGPWLGKVVKYVPGIGRELPPRPAGEQWSSTVKWSAEADGDGRAVWDADQIRATVKEGPQALAVMLGEPWDAAIGAMPTGERIVKQPTREVEWDRTTGEFTILAGDDPDPAAVDAVLLGVTAASAMTDADKQRGTAALAEQGWWAVEPWTRVDARGRFWSTEAVRLPSTPEPGKGER
jgi:hypothetical protein